MGAEAPVRFLAVEVKDSFAVFLPVPGYYDDESEGEGGDEGQDD